MIFLLAAALPLLWWTGAPDASVPSADLPVSQICVDAESLSQWKKFNQQLQPCSMEGRQRATPPGVDRKVNVASATRSPWINANAWRYRRSPGKEYVVDSAGSAAALAVAEAWVYGASTAVRAGGADAKRAAAMLHFLATLGEAGDKPRADIAFVDDGTPLAAEAMNLLNRRNILFQRVTPKDNPEGKVVRIGSPEFPREVAANPSEFATRVRQWIGDSNRRLRIFGTENVLAQVTTTQTVLRVHLLNYTGEPAEGVRVRLQGNYAGAALKAFDVPDAALEDISPSSEEIEFTIPVMKEYAVVELKPKLP